MLTLLRRSLVLAVLMFWQGGFTFYASIVVPVGAEVLGSHRDQGFITRQVTNSLNFAGMFSLPILAWDIAVSRDSVRWRQRLRWALWGILVITLAGLFWYHPRLDALLDTEHLHIIDRPAFRAQHQQYLIVSTVQWAAALIGLVFSLVVWRAEDAALLGRD